MIDPSVTSVPVVRPAYANRPISGPFVCDEIPATPASEAIDEIVAHAVKNGLIPLGRVSYSCPGCDAWQIDCVEAPDVTVAEMETFLWDHAAECDPLLVLILERIPRDL